MSRSATAADVEYADLAAMAFDMNDEDLLVFLDEQTPERQAVIERALGERFALGWRATPSLMAEKLDPTRRPWAYTRLLGEKFRDAVEGRSRFQIWNIASRYGKSDYASRWGPAWALDRDPSRTILLVSYGETLASENSDTVRQNLRTHSNVLRAKLRRDRQERRRFVTPEGGGIVAAGIDASITGFPIHGAVVDDPFKDWMEAHSEARREHVWNQYLAQIRNRLEDDRAFIIVVHNRMHEDDLTGRLISKMEAGGGDEFEIVRIPTIAEETDPTSTDLLRRLPDPLGREPGEVIESERFSLDTIQSTFRALGSYLTSALQQQRPSPEEGGEIKRAWFRVESFLPPRFDEVVGSWDMKLKEKETGDYVVGQVWGRVGASYWLLDQLRGQWNQATTENAIALLAVRYPALARQLVENTGNGPEVMEALRKKHPDYEVSDETANLLGMTPEERIAVGEWRRRGLSKLIPVTVKGSKIVRARAVSGVIEAGDVHVPANAPWLGSFLDEVAAFPNATHDDQVDTMSQALSRLSRGPVKSGGAAKRTTTDAPPPSRTAPGGSVGRPVSRGGASRAIFRGPRPGSG